MLALDAGGTALSEGSDLFNGGHGRVAGKCGEQRAVGPAQFDSVFRRLAVQQAVDEARGKAITAANTIDHIEIDSGCGVGLAVDPGYGAPAMTAGGVDFAQRRGDDFHSTMLFDDVVDHGEENAG